MDAHHIFKEEDPIRWFKEWFHSTNRRLAEPRAAERFTQMQVTQIRELLTQYGDIDYLWLDHIGETQGILDPTAVNAFWLAIVAEARRLQPNCLLLKNDIYLSRDLDAHGGVHGGRAAYPLWYRCRRENTPVGQGDPIPDPEGGDQFIVWESNTIFSGGWFWNGPEVKPVADMIEHYYATVGRGSTFLPNFAPDPCGLMTDAVKAHAMAFGDRVRRLADDPLAETAGTGPSLELKLASVSAVDHVVIMEDVREGQKIAAYTIEAQQGDGTWTEVASGESIGHKRINRFPQIMTDAIRFTCTRSFDDPVHIGSLAAFAVDC
jgi:alpha-L-fucosidase